MGNGGCHVEMGKEEGNKRKKRLSTMSLYANLPATDTTELNVVRRVVKTLLFLAFSRFFL